MKRRSFVTLPAAALGAAAISSPAGTAAAATVPATPTALESPGVVTGNLPVFFEALKKGWGTYLAAVSEPDAWSAIRLTLLAAAIAVPANLVFGIAAAWAVARFDFPGKGLLVTLIDLPFAVSPVISGMTFVLLTTLPAADDKQKVSKAVSDSISES